MSWPVEALSKPDPMPDCTSDDMTSSNDRFRLPGMRLAVAEVARPLRRLRRLELARRRARAGERRRAGGAHRYALAGAAGAARLYADIELEQHAAAHDRHRRVRSRARRRHRARIARAARRRAGHRQVDAAAAGGGEHGAHHRPGALQLGRGIRASDQVARRAARASATRRCICWPRPASSASSRRSRASSRRSSSSIRSRRSSR